MSRDEIGQSLAESYHAFAAFLKQLPDEKIHEAPPGKWSAAQQAEHLVKSVRPVALAFTLPKFMLPLMFGKANRPSRPQDELIERYKSKLASGGKSSRAFVPGIPDDLPAVYKRLDRVVQKLIAQISRFSEAELDVYILPHPLLGKLTFREMLYFTAYHARHHHRLIQAAHPEAKV
jgi:hypothetical protein